MDPFRAQRESMQSANSLKVSRQRSDLFPGGHPCVGLFMFGMLGLADPVADLSIVPHIAIASVGELPVMPLGFPDGEALRMIIAITVGANR